MHILRRAIAIMILVLASAIPVATHADDVSASGRGVVRVVTVAIVNGEVVGFGHGSGFAISPTRIITNAHVVKSAVEYPQNVALGVVPSEGKQSYEARLIAVDTVHDLALIEIVKGRLSPVSLYTGPIEPGADVIALGYPGNIDAATARTAQDYITPRAPTRSEGNFSNLQSINGTSALVHTASIARGNSGGPLLDSCGRVIGVNTFITRADDGDSQFAFAIANREVTQFLAKARQPYSSADAPCVSLEAANAKEKDRQMREASAQDKADAAAAAQTAVTREAGLSKARAANQTTRENRIAIAVVLFVAGALAAGYAGILFTQKPADSAPDARLKIAAAIAAALIMVAAIAFLTRPSTDVVLPVQTVAAGSQNSSATAPMVPATATGAPLACAFRADQSRVTVSAPTAVDFAFSDSGCVNGRTQYAPQPDGSWQRVMVSTSEDTITLATYDPTAKTYRTDRFFMGRDAMDKIRALKSKNGDRACSPDASYRAKLATQHDAMRSALPAQPNERLVYACSGAQ